MVVTGCGAVSAWGWGVEPLRQGLRSGRSAIRPTTVFDTRGQRTRVAGEVPPPPVAVVQRIAEWAQLAMADRFALAAADEAVERADLALVGRLAGTFFGGSTAGMLECERYLGRLTGALAGHPRLALLASQQINGPGDAVARHLEVTGPTYTVSSACASGGLAIAAAVESIRRGEVEVAVAGGADSLCLLTYSGFNSLRSVDPEGCRPFRADRAGLSIGEGAGILILESLAGANARGASPLAEILGWGSSCDAHHMTAPHPEGDGAAAAITRALGDAGISPDQVAFINAHGTGTPHNDVSEARAIERVFGARWSRVPVTATKASVGHLLGCSGAIEAVATVLAFLDGAVQPTPGHGPVDPSLGLDLVLDEPRRLAPGSVAVSTSFAFGGANAALVLAAWGDAA